MLRYSPRAGPIRRRRRQRAEQNEIALLKQFTRPRLTKLVRRNAQEFFDQVKKAGGRSESEDEALSETSDDLTDNIDVDELASDTVPVFGYAGLDEDDDDGDDDEPETNIEGAQVVIPANSLGTRNDGIDVRPAVKVDGVTYQVRILPPQIQIIPTSLVTDPETLLSLETILL